METTILTTKLNVPPIRQRLVTRPRLFKYLEASLNNNLVLVSAPAGFGKTTLLSEWLRQIESKTRVTWISLDEGDNDPVRFWDYFIAALKTIQPTIGDEPLALLHSPQSPTSQSLPIETVLTSLINELSNISFNLVLVLDDYHVITKQSIHDGMVFILDHIPPQMHLVIASRADPPLPLTRYRGKGIMLELRTDDLRFSLDEAATLLEELQDLILSPDIISTLNDRTGGWVTGLKMAVLSIPHQKDIPEFIATFSSSQRYIMDYLIEEVLLQQTEKIQDFLLRTSALERLNASLCDVVTGHNESQDVLLELEHNNMFINPLDETREWYRYEHLFRDLLNHQLEITLGESEIAELNRRASQWYEKNEYINDAIYHALIARDWESAKRLIMGANEQKRLSGEFVTLLNWLQLIPVEVIHSDIEFCSFYASTLIASGQFDCAASTIDVLEQAAKGNTEYQGLVNCWRSILAFYLSDNEVAIELGNQALSYLPKDRREVRAVLNVNLGSIHWQRGDFKEAEPFLMEAYEFSKRIGHNYIAVNSLSLLATADMTRTGKLRQAVERFNQCIELAGPTPAAASSHQVLGAVFYEWNDLENAAFHIQRAIDLGKLAGLQGLIASQYSYLARCKLAQGDEEGATKAMEESCHIAHQSDKPNIRSVHAANHILLAIRQNNLDLAFEWDTKLAEDINELPYYLNHIPARLLIARGEMTAAAEKLEVLYKEVIHGSTQSQIVNILLYQAIVSETTKSALQYLVDVFTITEPEGYIRTFVDEGKLLIPLLKQAISRDIYPEYASKLLTIIESEKRQKQTAEANKALLSKRELEVLKLLADGLSNQQIAEILVISHGTTKNHIHNILEKLNVQSRIQAVSRARELQLL
ncbi:MAG TPA: tetratricopeptide repeat protein [Dehalococcoidia bacterium]|nr:tetratricopeptide repeat protein [Dehalococcoidia bacterium]